LDGQYFWQFQAWNSSISFHQTFAPVSAVCEATIAAKFDHNDWATPIAASIVAFTHWNGEPAEGHPSPDPDGIVHAFAANSLSEINGILIADNCYGGAVVNVFIWPSV
jgi:hypothetical protein